MSLLVKAARDHRDLVSVTPASAGWSYVGFSAHRLAAGERLSVQRPGREACVVVLSGRVDVEGFGADGSTQRVAVATQLQKANGENREIYFIGPANEVVGGLPNESELARVNDSL